MGIGYSTLLQKYGIYQLLSFVIILATFCTQVSLIYQTLCNNYRHLSRFISKNPINKCPHPSSAWQSRLHEMQLEMRTVEDAISPYIKNMIIEYHVLLFQLKGNQGNQTCWNNDSVTMSPCHTVWNQSTLSSTCSSAYFREMFFPKFP